MIEKILVGYLASDAAESTLRLTANLAMSVDAELVVLEVEALVDARAMFDPGGVPARASPLGRLRHEHPGLRVRANEVRGHPLQTMVDVAEEERPDLIVIAHGPAGGGALLSLRASNNLVERAPCGVLLVAA